MGVPEDLERCGIAGYGRFGCALFALGGVAALLDYAILDAPRLRVASTPTALMAPLMPSTPTTPAASKRPAAPAGVVGKAVAEAFEQFALTQREKLAKYAEAGAEPPDPNVKGVKYSTVLQSIPLAPPILDHDPAKGAGGESKNIVGKSAFGKKGRCVVYGMGIATNSAFEQSMAAMGCETHAFDCTVNPENKVVKDKEFTFHDWCIGKSGSSIGRGNLYAGTQTNFVFKTLGETMKELGHDTIDLLKFDIEGFEWRLFEEELLTSSSLPAQLSFELHSEGANPRFVPVANVKGKGFTEVNKLFLDLFDVGYRVASKEVNRWDPACAEFVLVNVNTH